MRSPVYSVIVPVYNRPREADELLNSLTAQHNKNFEVLIIEDGSTNRCDDVVDRYRDRLDVHYFFKQNSGPGPSRNFGYSHARGQYFVVFDSDCIIPPDYFEQVEQALKKEKFDAWGGPDRAADTFTPIQRAMAYTMSSVLTTGGIRGGSRHAGWFQPRSFNMGISRAVFELSGGFKFDRFAEDIEFSIRMKREGFSVGLIPEAFVYHKRRTDFRQFYRQVYNFGKGRALVGKLYPDEIKLTHWFPTFFVVGILSLVPLFFVVPVLFIVTISLYGLYLAAVFVDSLKVNRNITVALLSVPSAVLQLWGYGNGFFKERIKSYTRKDV